MSESRVRGQEDPCFYLSSTVLENKQSSLHASRGNWILDGSLTS